MFDVVDDRCVLGGWRTDTGEANSALEHLFGEDVIDRRRQIALVHRDGAVRTGTAPTRERPLESLVLRGLEQRLVRVDAKPAVIRGLEVCLVSFLEEIVVLERPSVVGEDVVVEVADAGGGGFWRGFRCRRRIGVGIEAIRVDRRRIAAEQLLAGGVYRSELAY